MEKEKRRCGSGHIPEEILEEILVNLPVTSMVRFKAVSREWRATIESKSFIQRHMIRVQKSLESQARILVLSSETRYDHLAFDTILFSTNGIVHEISPYLPTITPFHLFQGSKISEPCDGLFCLFSDTRMSIFNPATTCCRTLPNPTSTIPHEGRRHYTLPGIGREKSERQRYKLVCFFEFDDKDVNESTKCKVFALYSNTWSYVDPPHCRIYYGHSLVHLDGVMYCFTRSIEAKVLAFDLHTHTFQSFSITPDIKSRYFANLSMRVLNHRLCIFNKYDLLLKIWGLDINKRSWELMHSIDFSNFSPQFKDRIIIPMATINNYVVITNYFHNLWLLYDSENHILHHTISFAEITSFETLVSAYQ